MDKQKKDTIIVKANELIEASYHLSLQEQRIIAYMSSNINKDDKDFKPICLSVSDFMTLTNTKGQNYYKQIKEVTDSLRKRDLELREDDAVIRVGWLSSVKYFYKKGFVELRFDPNLKPYFLQLKERFTKYFLKHIIQFNHSYSIRFYELLKQYEQIGSRYFKYKELRWILGIKPEEYKRYNDFKRYVLDPPKAEFEKKYKRQELDFFFDYREHKESRKVVGIYVDIKKPPIEELLLESQTDTPKEKTPDNELLSKLLEMKVSKRQANSLIKKYTPDVIQRNIELTQNKAANKMIDNVPAFLIEAIKNDYAKDSNLINSESRELHAEAIRCWNKNNGSCQARWSNHKDNTSSACHYCHRFKNYK